MLLCLIQVFTSTSTIVFKTFACDGEAVEGENFLRADYSLSCDSNVHMWFMVYAGIMIVVSKKSEIAPTDVVVSTLRLCRDNPHPSGYRHSINLLVRAFSSLVMFPTLLRRCIAHRCIQSVFLYSMPTSSG